MSTATAQPDDPFDAMRRALLSLAPAISTAFDPEILASATRPLRDAAETINKLTTGAMQSSLLSFTEQLTAQFRQASQIDLSGLNEFMVQLGASLEPLQQAFLNSENDNRVEASLRELAETVGEARLEELAENEPETPWRLRSQLENAFWRSYVWRDEKLAEYSPKAISGLRILYMSAWLASLKQALISMLIMMNLPEFAANLLADTTAGTLTHRTTPSTRPSAQNPLKRACPTCEQPEREPCVTVSGKAPGTKTTPHKARTQ